MKGPAAVPGSGILLWTLGALRFFASIQGISYKKKKSWCRQCKRRGILRGGKRSVATVGRGSITVARSRISHLETQSNYGTHMALFEKFIEEAQKYLRDVSTS